MREKVRKVMQHTPLLGGLIAQKNSLAHDKGILQLEKGALEAAIRKKDAVIGSQRNYLAEKYLKGHGIEIGAAHHPVQVPSKATVKYVDIFSSEELRKVFPEEYREAAIVDVDVIDDGETLATFKPNSLDFIIANHFIEHCLDPIGTIITMFKKLRGGGILYMAIPDKRYTFDSPRTLTSYEHLLAEHKDQTKRKFREAHTREYVEMVEKPKDINRRVEELLASGYRIHYHVWTQNEMTEMFVRLAKDFRLDFEIEALVKNHHEIVYILRKEPRHKPIDYHPQL